MTPSNGTESGDAEACIALPRRREAMLALERKIGSIGAKIRTDAYGVANAWQPSKFLPSFADPDRALGHIRYLQEQARRLPAGVMAVLIGDTATEEALPTYAARIMTQYGMPTGTESDVYGHPGPLQRWFRAWNGEEHRHGVVLNKFLEYSGRVNMDAYERTVQRLLMDGMDAQTGNDPYRGFVYTSFQELATQRSHMNVAKIASQNENPTLAEICGQIASDERSHAAVYREFVRILFEEDPNGVMEALREMFERGIVMPAHHMTEYAEDGTESAPGEAFEAFSLTAQHLGVYTAKDYAEIWAFLIGYWKIATKSADGWQPLPFPGLEAEGEEARQEILRRLKVIEKRASRPSLIIPPARDWSWLVKPKS